MNKQEEWLPVVGYEGLYEVSNMGRVRSVRRHIRQLKLYYHRNRYVQACLCLDGKCKKFYVHRLVAQAFNMNPANKPHINHIDGVRDNNCADNLEWVTQAENNLHKYRVLGYQGPHKDKKFSAQTRQKMSAYWQEHWQRNLHPRCRKVLCVELGRVFSSAAQAVLELNMKNNHISECCKGKRRTCGGYTWRYVNE